MFWSDHTGAWIPLPKERPEGRAFREKEIDKERVVLFYAQPTVGREKPLAWRGLRGKIEFAFAVEEWSRDLVLERYRPPHQFPVSARLPFHYHRIPAPVRNVVASMLLRQNRTSGSRKTFPVTDFNPGCEIVC